MESSFLETKLSANDEYIKCSPSLGLGLWTEIAQSQHLEILEYFFLKTFLAYSVSP